MHLSDLFLFQLHLECFLKTGFARNYLRERVFQDSGFVHVFPLS